MTTTTTCPAHRTAPPSASWRRPGARSSARRPPCCATILLISTHSATLVLSSSNPSASVPHADGARRGAFPTNTNTLRAASQAPHDRRCSTRDLCLTGSALHIPPTPERFASQTHHRSRRERQPQPHTHDDSAVHAYRHPDQHPRATPCLASSPSSVRAAGH
ncbi:hypothetical protein BJV78DRAFT_249407 [Lactifluus subvellereus]|nr:hypothetical protein BJV78DRAFT_249407 [Lactifluus subvellereus]